MRASKYNLFAPPLPSHNDLRSAYCNKVAKSETYLSKSLTQTRDTAECAASVK